jgi:hypothetical protein
MTGHITWFSNLTTIPDGQWPIKGIGPRIIYAKGIGTINIDHYINNEWQSGSLQEVLYIPGLSSNLFSFTRAASRGIDTTCS